MHRLADYRFGFGLHETSSISIAWAYMVRQAKLSRLGLGLEPLDGALYLSEVYDSYNAFLPTLFFNELDFFIQGNEIQEYLAGKSRNGWNLEQTKICFWKGFDQH